MDNLRYLGAVTYNLLDERAEPVIKLVINH